jgi:hypothetical protein
MASKRDDWLRRIKTVEREYKAARFAITRLLNAVERDPTILLRNDPQVRDFRTASGKLDATYFIRLFAEFETGVRKFWETIKGTHPPATDLLEAVAARRQISRVLLTNVHDVREYRNFLVHDREDALLALSLETARSHLCKFFSHLPMTW